MTLSVTAKSISPVHPHSRGEHSLHAVPRLCQCGSSPLAWGTCAIQSAARLRCRFIPTRVGNMHKKNSRQSRWAVHPHSRGEHLNIACNFFAILGSSPLAWGTSFNVSPHHRPARFIPTRVGNIRLISSLSEALTVHPHSRGEHDASHRITGSVVGSSPLAWGTSF